MPSLFNSKAGGYIVAVLAVACAALVRQALHPILQWHAPLLIFALPVLVAAAYRGFGPGVFATVLGLLAGEYLFFGLRSEPGAVGQVQAVLFAAQGLAISAILEQIHKGRRRIVEKDAALRASEARFRTFFDLISVGIAQVETATGRFIEVNDAFCRITGYPRDELLERTFSDLTHPEHRATDAKGYGRLRKGEVHAYATEKRYVRKDGEPVWVRVDIATIRGPAGAPPRSMGIIQEIGERKRAEEDLARQREAAETGRQRLRAVLDLLPVAVFISDASGTLQQTNHAVEAIWGGAPPPSHAANYAEDYRAWWPGTGRRVEAHEWGLARALATGEHCIAEEMEIEAFDGRPKSILNYALPLRDEHGHISGGVALNVDITDRKEAEVALRKSEQRLRATIDNAGVGIAEADAAGRIVAANERFCQIAGRSCQELESTTVHDMTHPEDRAESDRLHAGLVEGRIERFAHEKRYVRPDDSLVWVRFTVSAVRDDRRRFLRSVAVVEDVTERKQAEAALQESEARLRLAMDSTELGAFDFHPQAGKLIWSEFARRHFGLPTEAEVSYDAFLRGIHPADRERVERVVQAALRPEGGGQFAAEYRTIGIEDGKERWIDAWGRVFFDSEGHARRLIGVTLDITYRKLAETALRESELRERARAAELEAIMDAVPLAVFIARDPECREIFGSRACYELLRRPPGSNLSKSAPGDGATFRIMRDGKEISPPELPMQQSAHTGRPVRNCELDFVFDDGTRRTVLGDAVPMLDADGRPWGVIGAFFDITDRKRAEEHLRQTQKLESVGLLAGGIAHDFNNLLVGIIGNASLAQDMLPPASPAAEVLDSVVKIGEKAAHLTRQMLAYAGKGRFVVEPVNLSELVPEMVELVQPSLSKKVALHFELEPDLQPVEADRGQIQQVVMNLVLNAAEAIGSDAGLISVRTGVRDVDSGYNRQDLMGEIQAGKYVYLEVRDTGCGMDEATKDRIFDPFFSTKFTGRGLGLAAVAGIVRGHKGDIQVESAPGKGTQFTVLFPAAERAAPVSTPEAGDTALRGAGTVLVVDDEEIVREIAMRALERYGFKVLLAAGGAAAIDLFKRYPGEIALVVLDLSMPDMSGEETLPELRRIRPGARILVSSGYSESETMRLFHGYPVAGFVQKPYTAAQLAGSVKAALG